MKENRTELHMSWRKVKGGLETKDGGRGVVQCPWWNRECTQLPHTHALSTDAGVSYTGHLQTPSDPTETTEREAKLIFADWFLFMCLCVWVPMETRRGHRIPWSWSYMWLWVATVRPGVCCMCDARAASMLNRNAHPTPLVLSLLIYLNWIRIPGVTPCKWWSSTFVKVVLVAVCNEEATCYVHMGSLAGWTPIFCLVCLDELYISTDCRLGEVTGFPCSLSFPR